MIQTIASVYNEDLQQTFENQTFDYESGYDEEHNNIGIFKIESEEENIYSFENLDYFEDPEETQSISDFIPRIWPFQISIESLKYLPDGSIIGLFQNFSNSPNIVCIVQDAIIRTCINLSDFYLPLLNQPHILDWGFIEHEIDESDMVIYNKPTSKKEFDIKIKFDSIEKGTIKPHIG